MRVADRNRKPFWYSLFVDSTEQIDENGDYSGEGEAAYADPVKAYGRISPVAGNAGLENFGIGIEYDRTIALDGTDWPITEDTGIFIDKEPEAGKNDAFDYRVTAVRPDINFTLIAVKKVR